MDLSTGSKHVLDYWSVLVRRRWVIYLALFTVTLAVLVGSFLMTPLYRATATLQIERQAPDILTFRDLAKTDYSWAAYSDYYETQYKIMASSPVARRTAQRLELTTHPDFTQRNRPGWIARVKSLIPRRGSARSQDPTDIAANWVRGGLEVAPVRNSQLVMLSWVSPDPELAGKVANAVCDAYIQFNIESQYSTSSQAEGFLVNQIGQLKAEIRQNEERLQEYGESKSILTIDDSNNLTLQALGNIATRRTEAQTRLAAAEAAYRTVESSSDAALPEVTRSELVGRLRQEHALYEAELSEQASRFGEAWPGVQTLRSKLEKARQRMELETERIASQVRAAAEAEHQRARAEVENLDLLVAGQETAAQALKRDAVEYANLQSEVNKKRETLNALIRRQNEMALSTRLQDPDSIPTNVRIVERARVPVAPFRPNTKTNLALGLFLGLAVGVGLAFFLDYLDNTINSVDELRKQIQLPLLAVIPRHGSVPPRLARVRPREEAEAVAPDMVSHLDARAGAAEAYRELRTSLLLSNPGKPPGTIMLTSALPEEGKTATAINLATVLAQLGGRVLLVDTDLRRPRLHRALDLENRTGVSTYLSGLEEDPQRLVAATEIPNLDLLASGPIPPNPSELLNSSRFVQLGRVLLDSGYDHVIFDSPPILSVSDPVIIANAVDMAVLVVRAGHTPRQSVRLAAEKFTQIDGSTCGAVLNDLDVSRDGNHHGYYYGRYDATSDASETRRADAV